MNKNDNRSVSKLLPVLFGFFVMGFCDVVGISTTYVKNDFNLSEALAGFIPSMVFLWFLLLSVPYLNLMLWSGAEPSRSVGMLIGLMPLLRAFLAMVIVTGWLVGNKVRRLLTAYVFTVVVFTYISGLVFYDYEVLVNPKLHGFGNALWWAWMNVTTVGAEIFPVTAVGKVFCVLLPSLGMMFFPIFTTYVLQEYAPSKTKDE